MTDRYSTLNNLHLSAILRDHGLDRPLTDDELARRLLTIELRLSNVERSVHGMDQRGRRQPTTGEWS